MSTKPPLLFLAHRIPYPPNKGDKIRSFNLLKYLSNHFSIYLAAFVDEPDDWQFCPIVRGYCADALFIQRKPRIHKVRSVFGLANAQALSVWYYRSKTMQQWVDLSVQRHMIDRCLIFCSPMFQFVAPGTQSGDLLRLKIMDFVDVDSEKWRQYAAAASMPMSRVYQREFRLLSDYEERASQLCQKSYFVSQAEAALFKRRAATFDEHPGFFSNGVDLDYFDPVQDWSYPFAGAQNNVVFTGAMDYAPNVDAVTWFATEVLPALRDVFPDLQFWIVGGKPAADVMQLKSLPGIEVTGRVVDVRPFLQHATAVVAPMRIARGVQNKVLEALAMARPIIASQAALDGIFDSAQYLQGVYAAETVSDYVQSYRAISAADLNCNRRELRDFTAQNFSWEAHLAVVRDALLA